MARKFGRRTPARAAGLGFVIGSVLLSAGCSSTTVAFKQGIKAEQQHNYDAAVVDFQKALQSQPDNPRFQLYEKDARAEDSILHLKRGRELLKQNQPDAAAAEFRTAVGVDPSNQAAAQELQAILLKQAAEKARRDRIIRNAMEHDAQPDTAGVIELHPLSRAIIPVLHIGPANSKDVFEALGKIAGLNVVFYHEFENHPLALDLESVTIQQALDAAEASAGVFSKPITPNTILLIPDNPMNRQRLESDVLKTVYLQNPMQTQDRMAILTAVKQVIGLTKSFEDPDANALILYGTPEQVNAADQLIQGLDRGKAEILIDVSVMEADKTFMRDLGLEPLPISGNALAGLGFNPPTSTTTTSSSTGTTTTTPYVNLNQLGKIGTGDFSIVLGSAEANAIMSNEITHILQSPQVRVMAGQKATLKIGEQYPYATGSFGLPTTSVSTTSSTSLLSETQFQYQQIGVELDVQPDVAANGDVILKSKVVISAFGGDQDIGGVEEPLFTDRSVEHTVRLQEGETSLLGGLIQSQIENTVTGLPGLSDVPVLKYFFSDNNKQVTDQEVLIMMTPHIIRLPEPLSAAAAQEIAAPASGSAPSPVYGGGFRGGRP